MDRADDRSRAAEGGVHVSGERRARSCSSSSSGEPGMEASLLRCRGVCEERGATDVIIAARRRRPRASLERAAQLLARAARGARLQASEDIVVRRARSRDARARRWLARKELLMTATFGTRGRRQPARQPPHRREPPRRRRRGPHRRRARRRVRAALDLGGTSRASRHRHLEGALQAWEQSAEVIDLAEALEAPLGSARAAQPGQDLHLSRGAPLLPSTPSSP